VIRLECQSQINPLLPTPKGVLRDPISEPKMGEEKYSSPKMVGFWGRLGGGASGLPNDSNVMLLHATKLITGLSNTRLHATNIIQRLHIVRIWDIILLLNDSK
jgi:hypothetical protein